MKKSIQLIIIAVIMSTVGYAQKMKIGHVNYEKVVSLLAVKDSINEKLQATAMEFQKVLEQDQRRYDRDVQEYLDNQGTYSAAIQQEKEEQLRKRQQELQQTQQRYQQLLQREQQKMADPLIKKVEDAVAEYAKENGFTYVFDENSTVYAGGENITNAIVKILNLENIESSNEPNMNLMPQGGGMQGAGGY